MHGDCGDGDAVNCFQGAEFEWVRGDALCTLATCGDCGDDDAISYFQGTELEKGAMPLAHLLHVVIVAMMMQSTTFGAQS